MYELPRKPGFKKKIVSIYFWITLECICINDNIYIDMQTGINLEVLR